MIGITRPHLPLLSKRPEAAQRGSSSRTPVHVSTGKSSPQQVLERSSKDSCSSVTRNGPAAQAASSSRPPRPRPAGKTNQVPLQQKSKPGRVPWSDQHAKVLKAIRDRGLIEPGSKVLVAVSGGQVSKPLSGVLGLRLTLLHSIAAVIVWDRNMSSMVCRTASSLQLLPHHF